MIRLAITQPDIRPYRLPVYNLLAQQAGIELTLFADTPDDAPAPDPAEMRFRFEHSPITRGKFGPIGYNDQPSQLEVMDPDRFDMVIMPWNVRYRTLAPALKLAQKRRMPTIVWGHGYSKTDNWLRTTLRNRVARRATGIMLYTHPIANRLVERYGFDRDRTFVAQNAIDQTPIQSARADWLSRPEKLTKFRTEQRLDPTKTIVFVSRLRDENRPDQLILATATLAERHPALRLIIVGDGPERAALESLANETGIAERTTFTGTIYRESELAPWLLSSTLFCYPENIGLSLLTAFGFGLPTVTADNIAAQNPEIDALRHGRNGLLYKHGDRQAMINAIDRLLTDDKLRERLSCEALRTVTEEFTLPNMVQGFLDATRIVDGERRRMLPSTV